MSDNGYLVGSHLEKMLQAGHFVVTGELGPPQSADPEVIREKAQEKAREKAMGSAGEWAGGQADQSSKTAHAFPRKRLSGSRATAGW